MTELVLILGINLAGLAFAVVLARWAIPGGSSTTDLRRLGSAVERASRSFLAGAFRQVALASVLVATIVGSLHAFAQRSQAAESGVRIAVWSLLGLFVGALLTCVVAHFSAQLSHRASLGVVSALRVSADNALSSAMRAGGAIGLLSECVGVLGVCLLFSLVWALTGEASSPFRGDATYVLGGFALGAALSSLLIQRSGAVYHAASGVGAELGGEREADLAACDPRNPAAVANLVGDHVGNVASRAMDLFLCATVANTAVLLIGAHSVADDSGDPLPRWFLLPIVIKSFGVIASAFGVAVVRTEETSDPSHGVWRGHVTTLVICLGALLGSTLWIVGRAAWPPFFVAGALGLLAAAAASYGGLRRVQRRSSPLRTILEALKTGDSTTLAQAVATGLNTAALPCVAVSVALVASWQLGLASGLHGGGMLAVSLALMTMLASGPFMLAANVLGPVSESARGFATLASVAGHDDQLDRRAHRIQDAGSSSDAFAQSFWILVSGVAALFAASTIVNESATSTTKDLPLDLAHPAIAYCGLLGGALVLLYAGGVLQAASHSVRSVVTEVERQLRGFPKERGRLQIPPDYIPSYRACIEIVARSALSRPLIPVIVAVTLPVTLGPGLILLTVGTPSLVRAAMASFVLAGTVTGLTAAFAAETIRGCLGSVRRQARGRPAGADSALQANGFAELVGNAAGPAAQLVLKTAAVGSLIVAPFLS